MLASTVLAGMPAAASYYPAAPPDHAAWDTLYAALAALVMLALIVLAASFMNARDAHREQ